MTGSFVILVEQYLLTRNVGVLIENRRLPVIGAGRRTAAVHAVLLAFETATVVPPVAATGRHRQVGLLGARLDLVEDLLPQRFQISRPILDMGVLRLEMGDHLGVGLVSQPLVGIEEDVLVMDAAGVQPFGDRSRTAGDIRYRSRTAGDIRFARRHAPIQSANLRPEIRS